MKKKLNGIDDLYKEAADCGKRKECYCQKIKIFVPRPDNRFGKKNVKVLFISEQPGPETVRTGKISPDNNDPSAERFKELLKYANLKIGDVFCTNARICIPFCTVYFTERTYTQVKNCSEKYLKEQIKILDPKLIVTLGNTALNALKNIFESNKLKKFKLKTDIRNYLTCQIDKRDYKIYPLYHVAKKAIKARPVKKQKEDWANIKVLLKNQ